MEGDVEGAQMAYIIRDHDREKFEQKKAFFEKAAEFLNAKYGAGTVTAVVKDSYYNMKEKIEPHMELIHIAENAMRKNGVTPVISPVRGGTDGARLSTWDFRAQTFAQVDIIITENMNMYVWSLWNRRSTFLQRL